MGNFTWDLIAKFKPQISVKSHISVETSPLWLHDIKNGVVLGKAIVLKQDYDNGNLALKKGDTIFVSAIGEEPLFGVTHFMPAEIPTKPVKEVKPVKEAKNKQLKPAEPAIKATT